jgi:hypothetical protein
MGGLGADSKTWKFRYETVEVTFAGKTTAGTMRTLF